MEIYQAIKKTEISNTIVETLNANVLTSTFETKIGVQMADVYESPNEPKIIVKHGNCPPVNSEYLKTIYLIF
jgi:NADH:ubiquinone oxidoreductase subunit B-like Fe-S oxidoreductase